MKKKKKVRTKKRSDIINIGENDDNEDTLEPREREAEMIFAEESMKVSTATNTTVGLAAKA